MVKNTREQKKKQTTYFFLCTFLKDGHARMEIGQVKDGHVRMEIGQENKRTAVITSHLLGELGGVGTYGIQKCHFPLSQGSIKGDWDAPPHKVRIHFPK